MLQCLASALWDAEGSVYDVMRAVQVTVGGFVGTSTEAFSFDAPVASFVETEHGSQLRGVCDSDAGCSFGLSEYTATGQLLSGVCSTTSWSSSTSLCSALRVRCGMLRGVCTM